MAELAWDVRMLALGYEIQPDKALLRALAFCAAQRDWIAA